MDATKSFDFLGPLSLRLYLVPIFWLAATEKIGGFDNTVNWFGDPDWGLGLPLPVLMASLAVGAELLGAVLLLIGLGVRWICVPLLVTMWVAAITVHLKNGWLAIATGSGIFATERTIGAVERLGEAKSILKEHGNFVVLNNGIEFAATYFIMLLALFFVGGGRYVSVDCWLARKWDGQLDPGALQAT